MRFLWENFAKLGLASQGMHWKPLSLEKLKNGLGTVQEKMQGVVSPMLASGMSYTSDRILPSYIPGTLTGRDSLTAGWAFISSILLRA